MLRQRWFTVNQVAGDMQVEDETILAAIHRGDLDAINVAKEGDDARRPSWRIPELALVRWQLSRRRDVVVDDIVEAQPSRKSPKKYV